MSSQIIQSNNSNKSDNSRCNIRLCKHCNADWKKREKPLNKDRMKKIPFMHKYCYLNCPFCQKVKGRLEDEI